MRIIANGAMENLADMQGNRCEEMNEAVIDYASEYDREELLKLYKTQIGREFCAWDEDYPSDETIDFDLSRDALFVMKENGRIIAAISIEEDEEVDRLACWNQSLRPAGELARLAVEPASQNKGIARKMLQHGLEVLKTRGCRSVHFLVNRYNKKAIRSYACFHFEIVGECRLYDQDFLCYEKEL